MRTILEYPVVIFPMIFEKIIQRSRGVADQMGGGIEFLFKKNKVDYIVGKGMVRSAGQIEITDGDDAGKIISGNKIMIATGCKPRTLDEVAVDGVRVMTSREALAMKKQPESIAIMQVQSERNLPIFSMHLEQK